MNIEQFNNLLREPEYHFTDIPSPRYEEFEKLRKYGEVANLFEELEESLGRPPTQSEYIQIGLIRAEEFFRTNTKKGYRWFVLEKNPDGSNRWGKFNWDTDERLHQAVTQRLSRTYQSKLAELSIYHQLICMSNIYDIEVGTHDYLDLILGVDIAVRSETMNKTSYFHVSSESGALWIPTKEGRSVDLSDIDTYTRDFSKNHQNITYTLEESDKTLLINNNVTIRREYIELMIATAMMEEHSDTYQSEQIEELKKRLEEATNFSSLKDSDIWATNSKPELIFT